MLEDNVVVFFCLSAYVSVICSLQLKLARNDSTRHIMLLDMLSKSVFSENTSR